MSKTQMYNLVYLVSGKIKETLEVNKPIALCKYKMNLAKRSGHYNNGLLQCRKIK